MSKSPLSKNTSHLRNSKNKKKNHKLIGSSISIKNTNKIFQTSLHKSRKFKKNKSISLYKMLLQKKHLANTYSKIKKEKRNKFLLNSKRFNKSLLLKPLSIKKSNKKTN